MRWIKLIAAEVLGLFVDDGPYAAAILGWARAGLARPPPRPEPRRLGRGGPIRRPGLHPPRERGPALAAGLNPRSGIRHPRRNAPAPREVRSIPRARPGMRDWGGTRRRRARAGVRLAPTRPAEVRWSCSPDDRRGTHRDDSHARRRTIRRLVVDTTSTSTKVAAKRKPPTKRAHAHKQSNRSSTVLNHTFQ